MDNKTVFQTFLEDVFDAGVMPYSGRGMYGRQCIAVNLTSKSHLAVAELAANILLWVTQEKHEYTKIDIQEIADHVANTRVDDLGQGSVCYWPTEVYIEEEEEEDLEDA